jgi:pimeloyl-ACP methyl ester carboxylesterase
MTLAHDRTGSGPPLVLIHGIGSRRGAWKPVIARLAAERDTIAVDLPGFGESSLLPEGVVPTPQTLADAIEAFWTAELGIERPHVAGNSLGGGIVLELARRGAVASATALSPIGFWSPAEVRYGTAMLRNSRFAAQHFGPALQRVVRTPLGRQLVLGLYYGHPMRRDPGEAVADLAGLGSAPGWEATLPNTRRYRFRDGEQLRDVPVTIGWGTRDRLLIPRQAQRARAALPRARHVPLPGCGHLPMSDDPETVAALILSASS